jgi:hypothetical protein
LGSRAIAVGFELSIPLFLTAAVSNYLKHNRNHEAVHALSYHENGEELLRTGVAFKDKTTGRWHNKDLNEAITTKYTCMMTRWGRISLIYRFGRFLSRLYEGFRHDRAMKRLEMIERTLSNAGLNAAQLIHNAYVYGQLNELCAAYNPLVDEGEELVGMPRSELRS